MSSAAKIPEKAAPKKRSQRMLRPPQASGASAQARRQAAAILEVLAGLRRPSEAAGVLGTSLVRYYHLERRALGGLLAACEPAPRGPRCNPLRRLTSLEREVRRLERECGRQQALVRAAERTLGLPPPIARSKEKEERAGSNGKKRRRVRRPTVRALKVVKALRSEEGPADSPQHGGVATGAGSAVDR